jgi:hypothetical protein
MGGQKKAGLSFSKNQESRIKELGVEDSHSESKTRRGGSGV